MDRNTEKTEDTSAKRWSLSARRAWIEIPYRVWYCNAAWLSLSARRAWIEIGRELLLRYQDKEVALRKESVDRNTYGRCVLRIVSVVALRKESVDRNYNDVFGEHLEPSVALRKESVDRNWYSSKIIMSVLGRSPQGERG